MDLSRDQTRHDGAMTCRLPAELVDAVLDSLCNDEKIEIEERNASLHALCLASRGMKQHAAPLLYSTVVLSSPRRVQVFFAAAEDGGQVSSTDAGMRLHLRHLWCGIVNEVLYAQPHKTLASGEPIMAAREVAWMQADSAGRYHGFHYSTSDLVGSTPPIPDKREASKSSLAIRAIHVVCPDLGRWATPLFERLSALRRATITLYPSGNWDIEEAKLERVLRSILASCPLLSSLHIIIGHTVAAAGSRLVRMTRSIPISHAVRRVHSKRVSISPADFLFGVHGRSPADDIVLYTRQLWDERRRGGPGPWPDNRLSDAEE